MMKHSQVKQVRKDLDGKFKTVRSLKQKAMSDLKSIQCLSSEMCRYLFLNLKQKILSLKSLPAILPAFKFKHGGSWQHTVQEIPQHSPDNFVILDSVWVSVVIYTIKLAWPLK